MKTETWFECEVCGFRSMDRSEAEACEAFPILRAAVKPGDIVHCNERYGWWGEDMNWFHAIAERPRVAGVWVFGHPTYVVLDIVPIREVAGRNGDSPWGHREAVVLFSPGYANSTSGKLLAWTAADHKRVHKLGEVTPEELERYRALNNGLKPSLL